MWVTGARVTQGVTMGGGVLNCSGMAAKSATGHCDTIRRVYATEH